MKQAISALGWATTILWILVILFSGTVVYSAMQIRMNFQGEPKVTASNGTLTMSIPFSVSNDGLYDISNLNITTSIKARNETVISSSSTHIEIIPKGGSVNKTYDVIISLNSILAKNLTYMIFNDTELNVDMIIKLTYANSIPLKMSSNQTMLWWAPICNLTVEVSPVLPNQADIFVSFENHAFFPFNGTIYLELVDDAKNELGSGSGDAFVPPGERYADSIRVTVTGNPWDVAEVHLWFNTTLFNLGPKVIEVD
jgi:hypothetical protein